MKKIVAVEAIFGSQSRGDGDQYSDRDYLIVDGDTQMLRQRQQELEKDGWSVASYTYDKLEAIACKGALFVQHLKDEADILNDRDGRLARILSSFRPKVSYAEEIAENNALLSIAQIWPGGARGALWVADVLYVTLRNYGILRLAEKRIFVFSFFAVIDALLQEKLVRKEGLGPLRKLRLAKSLYRNNEKVSEHYAELILKQAIAYLPDEFAVRHFFKGHPREILDLAHPLPKGSPAYHTLRNLEKLHIAASLVDPAISARSDQLQRWIANPRAYAGLAAQNQRRLLNLFERVRMQAVREPHDIQPHRLLG